MGISSGGSEQGTKLLVCCLIMRTGLGREGHELGCDPVSEAFAAAAALFSRIAIILTWKLYAH
jgi:hypothetical protein